MVLRHKGYHSSAFRYFMENGWFHQGLGESCGAELGAELEGCGWKAVGLGLKEPTHPGNHI